MKKSTENAVQNEYEFVSPDRLCTLIDISRSTCKRRRLDGSWLEGIHWVKVNSRTTRYNFPLIRDWLVNHSTPHIHQRAVDAYISSLLSQQPQRRKAKKV